MALIIVLLCCCVIIALVVGYRLGHDDGYAQAYVTWMPKVFHARKVHLTDLANVGEAAFKDGPTAVYAYVTRAMDAVPNDVDAVQTMPERK